MTASQGPLILALDTATSGCSACVWQGDEQGREQGGHALAARATPMARGQAQELMPLVDAVLREAGFEPADLDGVAVTRGPGAFTGLRIALAAARAFAMALGVPCIGVTTLEAVVRNTQPGERDGRSVLACVESKRADIYAQLFDAGLAPMCEPLAADGAALAGLLAADEKIVLVGDGATRALEMLRDAGWDGDAVLSPGDPLPDPAQVAALAQARLGADVAPPEPLYLRPPDAKLPKAGGRLRA